MDTKLQTSFIPKKPIISSGKLERQVRPTDFFSLIVNVLLVIALLASVGAFAYQWYLSNRIKTLDTQLAQMEKVFEPELIAELARVDSRLKSAKEILGDHISAITFFEFLEATTFQSVQFTSFSYALESNSITVEVGGKAKNYSTLVLQSDKFLNSKYVQNVVFSNLDLDSTGNVIFSIALQLDKNELLYKNNIQTLSFEGFPF